MDTVSVSTKYQVVIPRAARKQLHIYPGQKMQVIAYNNRVVMIPVRPIQEARGALKGIDTTIARDEKDRV
ncbi:MAG: AbrB/MazE/SpoVT family DNA-binding domain-containing protein [Caldilineaceae bacterium]|jgi:AbrB family looped-hinge helix DNA binding protein|uniref:AbrB/MazE/SpoVT family DNA-binding domain-containing protein n=1 Tax=Caldilinea sp. TaxID=2293560 RepID=UPI0019DBCE82|nr:AbrB/MazE/SpoVT family DNA-binding domain-containing protein [Caldilineaceae bacterium]MBK8795862.1 AbrB/MazE/SpoVT family DNA-binding domain-containing protein [Anaerolineales bacterium]HQY91816.1 AbrB/MazE/SpoVT family DNA-binding domain-containing protein [Caldilinea sp.]HRA66310.1 AbrB/MazE/SpoVT family DNA-binding domain-containing protein [Caldilinea sp.]